MEALEAKKQQEKAGEENAERGESKRSGGRTMEKCHRSQRRRRLSSLVELRKHFQVLEESARQQADKGREEALQEYIRETETQLSSDTESTSYKKRKRRVIVIGDFLLHGMESEVC